MYYIRLCYDRPGMLEQREATRSAHREYLATQKLPLLVAGPLCVSDASDDNTASFMIVEADSRDEVVRMHEGDPFTKAGIYGDVHIHRWDKHVDNRR